ncbi:unnamed protein product [Rotaria sp. Silwood2]|nr:unnamed protein product [Rotaria sp. Silwood2]
MADQTLLAKARKARFDDLPNFSEHPSEDVERFLKIIKNITKANDESDNHEILEIVRGKLTQSAGIWFDNNENKFNKWADFETAFRNRYFSTTMIHKKFDTLKQRKQLYDEPVTSYFDDVVNLCREIDPAMSEQIIIQHLMSGVNPDFKKELSRRESSMNTLNEFLKYVKIEQDLYDTFEKSRNVSLKSPQPYYNHDRSSAPSLTAMINQPKQDYRNLQQDNRLSYAKQSQRSVYLRNSVPEFTNQTSTMFDKKQIRNFSPPSIFKNKLIHTQPSTQHQFTKCRICARTNHRTIDCFYKRTTGCFNCGHNHIVRDCTMPPNFQ